MSRTRALTSWVNTLALTAAAAMGIVLMSSHIHPATSASATTATTAAAAAPATAPASTASTATAAPSGLTPISVTYHGGDDGGSSHDY
jgi:hypothetical protein